MDLRRSGDSARLLPRPLLDGIARFARSLSTAPHSEGGLLAVGTQTFEPWHLVAHLRDAARLSGHTALVPSLVRHDVPGAAPAHLSIGLDRLARTGRGETVLLVAPSLPDEYLLERLCDAKRHGSTVLALGVCPSEPELRDVVHDGAFVDDADLEPAQHLLPLSAAGLLAPPRRWAQRFSGRR
jgi:hypothetical protein